jgi:hypothetical protein
MSQKVTIAVTLDSFAEVEVETDSQAEAYRLVQESIEKEGFNSPYWIKSENWDTDWSAAEDLRVV